MRQQRHHVLGQLVLAAVITLAVLSLTLGGGIVYLVKTNRDDRKTGQTAADLYRAQQDLTAQVRDERDELVRKLAATDEQLREATIRLRETEQQRNEAQAHAEERLHKEIRDAPNALDALNRVLEAARGKAEASPAETSSGDSPPDPLLITTLV